MGQNSLTKSVITFFFFFWKCILHQKTSPYTPQQNGVLEKKHKHLFQIVRALIFQSHLPKNFWGEPFLFATYIINRLPTTSVNWRTSFELHFGYPPSYTSLRYFGCLCYAINIIPHKDKFDHRAIKCVFLGFNVGQKAYKLYDIQSKKIIVSREVTFYENIFPYYSIHESTPLLLVSSADDFLELDVYPSSTHDIPTTSSPSQHESPVTVDSDHAPLIQSLRRSTRTRLKPTWLSDFVSSTIQSPSAAIYDNSFSVVFAGRPYPINTYLYVANARFSDQYMSFLANIYVQNHALMNKPV